ncbi:MAG: SUMF1/EgtB/PvdO family nonheme iron enzyme, partial [Anaerolineae bacterium]|nr:SUMF1/EgtB/PvdO family nonheme iron enzyme [Anaerolineae bacterium]
VPSETFTATVDLMATETAQAAFLATQQAMITPSATATLTWTPTSQPTMTTTWTATVTETATATASSTDTATATPSVTATYTATDLPTATSTVAPSITSIDYNNVLLTPVTQNNQWEPVIQEINGIKMALVPPGCFSMGDDLEGHGGEQCFDNPFWISVTEITNRRYYECVDAGACDVIYGSEDSPRDEYPVRWATWNDALTYANWMNMRLPTEAEWEYAARGPDNLAYPWGNEFIAQNAVYGSTNIKEVGTLNEGISWVGALDMSGNVWEWTNSLGWSYPYQADDGREDSVDPSASRIIRGGSSADGSSTVRPANRLSVEGNSPYMTKGIRLVLDVAVSPTTESVASFTQVTETATPLVENQQTNSITQQIIGTIIAPNYASLRFVPGSYEGQIQRVAEGREVTVLYSALGETPIGYTSNLWYYVEVQPGTRGWIFGQLIQIENGNLTVPYVTLTPSSHQAATSQPTEAATLTSSPTAMPTLTLSSPSTSTVVPTDSSSDVTGTVIVGTVDMRRGPGSQYQYVGSLPRGTIVSILGRTRETRTTMDGWFLIQKIEDYEVWIRSTQVELSANVIYVPFADSIADSYLADTITGIINSTSSLYTGPSTLYPTVGSVAGGARIVILGRTKETRTMIDGWLLIDVTKNVRVWIRSGQVDVSSSIAAIPFVSDLEIPVVAQVNVDAANLRNGPGTNYSRSGGVARGAILDVVGRTSDGEWYQIEREDGTIAWVWSDLVLLVTSVDLVPIVESIPSTPTPQASNIASQNSQASNESSNCNEGSCGNGLSLPINRSGNLNFVDFIHVYSFQATQGNHTFSLQHNVNAVNASCYISWWIRASGTTTTIVGGSTIGNTTASSTFSIPSNGDYDLVLRIPPPGEIDCGEPGLDYTVSVR